MEKIFDLPAHPLFVHFPIVLIPLVAAGAVAMALRRSWRVQASPSLAVAAFVAAASTVLTVRAGNALNRALENQIGDLAADHKALGQTTQWLTIALFVSAAGVAGAQHLERTRDRESIHRGLMAATAVLGVLATIWTIRTGHEGSSIVWDGVLPD